MANYTRTRDALTNIKDSGPNEAIVVNNLDTRYMGGLTVELLKYTSAGGTPERTGQLLNVRYLSPFYGITPQTALTANDGFEHTQKSYGMWMVPPDIGTRVLVIFAEGNPNFGYWIGCVPADYMNFMVPDGRASTEKTTDHTPENLKGYKLPVGEYNKTVEDGSLVDPTLFNKPYNKDFTEVLEVQGLLRDEARGTTTSSARREIPSMVFGISTPGPKDYRSGAPQAPIGTAGQKINVPSNRLGGSSFVMDDGDDRFVRSTHAEDGPPIYKNIKEGETGDNTIPQNELMRLRTRTGHQILLHNSEDLIYISNSRGTAWVELSSDGKIDIYGYDSISVRSEADINFTADRDFNVEAGRNINMKASARYSSGGATDEEGLESGRIQFESAFNYNLNVGKDSKITVAKNQHTKVNESQYIETAKSLHVNTGQNNFLTAKQYTHINSGAEHRETAKYIHMNGPGAALANPATEVTPLSTITLPQTKPGNVVQPFETILGRAPQHEPWLHHENLDPLAFKKGETDRESPGALTSADRVLTPDTFFKNLGGRKSSAFVGGSGGGINSGVINSGGGTSTGTGAVPDPNVTPKNSNFKFSDELGSLSSKYESRGNPGAIGYDTTGGWSYGTYQIAAKTGAMDDFMNYAKSAHPDIHSKLQAAGGAAAAKQGTDTFKQTWKSVMGTAAGNKAQHGFGVQLYFTPAAAKVKRNTGIDVTTRSKTVQDVLWSTAIQHGNGGASKIFKKAVERTGSSNPSDDALIRAVYDERGANNGQRYFGKSKPNVRAGVVNRFKNEKADALKSLEQELSKTTTPPTISGKDSVSTVEEVPRTVQ